MGEKEKITILDKVAKQLEEHGTQMVETAAVETMVDRMILKWKEPMVQVLDKLEELRREHGKVRADQKSFDHTGKVVSETFSKAAIDNRNKISENIAKIEKAIEAFYATPPDRTKLLELAKNLKNIGGGDKGKPSGEDTSEG
jgi:hypothetical protein